MSTLEMLLWGQLIVLAVLALIGIFLMILSNRATCSESDYLVAQADEDDRRPGGGF